MREFVRELVASKERRQDQHERDLGLAWNIEALSRTAKDKRLPSLASLLGKRPPPETKQQSRAAVEMLAQMFGGRLRPVKKR